jgi:hypothetical protein
MSLTQPPPLHPAEFSPEVLDVFERVLAGVSHVHDPWAGRGVRLGSLCDRLGVAFTGTDIERYKDMDPRVGLGDSSKWWSYPSGNFTVVTSPVYLNRISTDYVNGPLPTTKVEGRRAYGISLGRALDRENLARTCRSEGDYYWAHGNAVQWWRYQAIVNVDLPMLIGWRKLLTESGFRISDEICVETRRYRGPANSDKRAPCEVVIVAKRPPM